MLGSLSKMSLLSLLPLGLQQAGRPSLLPIQFNHVND